MPDTRHAIHLWPLTWALIAASAAQAQEAPVPPSPPLGPVELRRQLVINDGLGPWRFSFSDTAPERVVKGAPYCADAVHETLQWLPDASGAAGNRIVNRQSTRLCRDGEGRTRQEVDRGGRKLVYLRDPVAGERWVLDLERKTARRVADLPLPGANEAPGGPGGNVGFVRLPRGDGMATIDVHQPPLAVQWRAQMLAPRGAGSTSPLGSKDFDGVPAHGERTTWVIEAGKIGNERPIQITREVWTAPELMVTVQSRDFDPRSGEVSYRLTNLKRGEPEPALMRVPAEFRKG